jgi:hypothetical protein
MNPDHAQTMRDFNRRTREPARLRGEGYDGYVRRILGWIPPIDWRKPDPAGQSEYIKRRSTR